MFIFVLKKQFRKQRIKTKKRNWLHYFLFYSLKYFRLSSHSSVEKVNLFQVNVANIKNYFKRLEFVWFIKHITSRIILFRDKVPLLKINGNAKDVRKKLNIQIYLIYDLRVNRSLIQFKSSFFGHHSWLLKFCKEPVEVTIIY